jgi:hypothetical protein
MNRKTQKKNKRETYNAEMADIFPFNTETPGTILYNTKELTLLQVLSK